MAPLDQLLNSAAGNREDQVYSNAFALGAGIGVTGQIAIKTRDDAWFVLQTMMRTKTGDFRAQFADDNSSQNWQNILVEDDNLLGVALRPNIMLVPLIIAPSTQILVNLENRIAGANAGEIALRGYNLHVKDLAAWTRGPRPDRWTQYAGRKAVAASNPDVISIKIEASSHFEVHKMMVKSTGAFSMRIATASNPRNWSDRLINSANYAGSAQYPAILPWPRLVTPNDTMLVEVLDLSAAPNTIEVVLEGVKRYEL